MVASRRWLLILSTSVALPLEGGAQLRPVESFDWRAFGTSVDFIAVSGISVLGGQRIALAGERGRLMELGRFHALVRFDRVVIEAFGTAVRRFSPDSGGSRVRQDAGQMHLATTVRLTPETDARALALRFGVGIPTTDNRIGLDRDETDFFATVLGRLAGSPGALHAVLGVGIFGARDQSREQNDVWLWSIQIEPKAWIRPRIVPTVELTGHTSTPGNLRIAGNEDLAELRAGIRIGGGRWLEVQAVRGLADYSPSAGIRLAAGLMR
ncbi:MAG: hypothetical protein ACT4OZ_11670 [Gemmatimonadota bacterium]